MNDARYESYMGLGPKRLGHWEHWSDPDAATWITGIDYYRQPRSCLQKLVEMYPWLNIGIPEKDDPIPRLEEQEDLGHGRWGEAYRENWQQDIASRRFATDEDILDFSPLAQGDFRGWEIVEDGDFRDEQTIYRHFRAQFPKEWGDRAPAGSSATVGFYNTMFMWPLLTFGYERFLGLCLEPRFERIMEEFAEINRRVFRAFARLPVNFVLCHDDIVLTSGPVCSPAWMSRFIFSRYEEFWSIVKAAGKEVIFMSDGCVDAFVGDVMACGARGVISEPYTNYKAIARRYKDCFIAGEGDNRILMRDNKEEIRAMVDRMLETSRMSGGYMMCIGNHIPFNVPGEAIKYYFDLSAELGYPAMIGPLWSADQIPFSLLYGGRPSSDLLPHWPRTESRESAAGGSVRVLTWRDPSTGLLITARVRAFEDEPGEEWVLELTNEGKAGTPVICDVFPLDAALPVAPDSRVVVHRTRGSLCQIDDFLPVDDEIAPQGSLELTPVGGRSSNGVMPFMNVEIGKRLGAQSHAGFTRPAFTPSGIALAIGWSGQWKAAFQRTEGGIRLSAGMERIRIRLHPGESVRTPRILAVPWEGADEFEGTNRMRRLILRHYVPRDARGEPQVPPIAHMRQLVYYFTGQAGEEDHLRAVTRAKELGIEAIWIDALWYGGGTGEGVDWAAQVGTWKVRSDRFPRGLKPIADAAHESGMKFVLWFEPERVVAGTEIARDHPELLLRKPGDEQTFLLDLGNPAARRHVLEMVSAMIAEVGIDIYRQDFNMEPLPYWQAADQPDRIGMHEIRHIEGLYALWDELLARHPGLAIDNCASGGRRIDLETTSRSFPLWRSDYTDAPALHAGYSLQIGAQCQVGGLSRWVPFHAAAAWTLDPYGFRSCMAAGVIPYMDIRASDYPGERAKAAFRELKRLRPFWLGDFRTIVPLTAAAHDWAAYQCHRPGPGDGFALFLRRHESPYPTCSAGLAGIDRGAPYDVTMSPTFEPGRPRRMQGEELAALRVTIEGRPGSLLVEYAPAG